MTALCPLSAPLSVISQLRLVTRNQPHESNWLETAFIQGPTLSAKFYPSGIQHSLAIAEQRSSGTSSIIRSRKAELWVWMIAFGQYISRNVYVEIVTNARGQTASQIEISLTPTISVFGQVSAHGGSNVNVKCRRDYRGSSALLGGWSRRSSLRFFLRVSILISLLMRAFRKSNNIYKLTCKTSDLSWARQNSERTNPKCYQSLLLSILRRPPLSNRQSDCLGKWASGTDLQTSSDRSWSDQDQHGSAPRAGG